MVSPASVWGQPLTDEEAAGLRERVRALKDHPGVFAWYMADEPELRPALVERCRKLYETVRDHVCARRGLERAGGSTAEQVDGHAA